MKLNILSKTEASSLNGIDGMISAVCRDDKNFYVAVDGGSIRKYPFSSDDLSQTSDDVFSFKDSHITCIDSTKDSISPNTFIFGCSDGTFRLCSANWRIEKVVNAHNGGIVCLKVNPDGSSIATAGEDGQVKIWSRTGSLRSTLASCGSAVTTLNWDSTGKYIMFSSGGNVTLRSASFKQDQIQFRAQRRLITCSDWNRLNNEILTGGEDRIARLFDSDGRLISETHPFEYAVTSIAFLPSAKLCLIGTTNRLYLADARLSILNSVPLEAGCAICSNQDQPRALVAGSGSISLISTIGKKLVSRDVEVILEDHHVLTVNDLRNNLTEKLSFTDSIIDFYVSFNNLIVSTQSKIHIYKFCSWTAPIIVETKDTPKSIAQSSTMFMCITNVGAQIYGYDGRPISRINEPRIKWELVSNQLIACSPALIAIVVPDDRRKIFTFSSSSGQLIINEPFVHSSEIRRIRINQAATQTKARFGFTNINGDLFVCRFTSTNPRQPPIIDSQKLTNFVDEFEWHTTFDVLIVRSRDKLYSWASASAVFFTPQLLPILRTELRLLFDPIELELFDGTHAIAKSKEGARCAVPISPFLIMLHEAIDLVRNWKIVLQICRAINEPSFWAVCASCAIQSEEIDAAQEAFASLSMIDRVLFLDKVKKMKSPSARNAMIVLMQGRHADAEEILIQRGLAFRAVKMNISLYKWDRALALAKRLGKFNDVVYYYRKLFIERLGITETDPAFQKMPDFDPQSVLRTIKDEKMKEATG